MNYTGAARAAMQRAATAAETAGRTSYGPVDILLALLGDPTNRATELLTACQIDLEPLAESLRTGRPHSAPDRVEPELRATRDRLLGRTPMRGTGLIARAWALLPIPLNWAGAPVMWCNLEVRSQAKQLGARRPTTDHLLLAILAAHEVAGHYPHLARSAADLYEGGRLLTAAGITYRTALAAAQNTELGRDPRPVTAYNKRDGQRQSTGTLLRALLDRETGETRAARLLAAMGAEIPAQHEPA